MSKTFDVVYYQNPDGRGKTISHQYTETWEIETTAYCPRCGVKATWVRSGDEGDYYVGQEHLCLACHGRFYLPGGVSDANDDQGVQRIQHLGHPADQ